MAFRSNKIISVSHTRLGTVLCLAYCIAGTQWCFGSCDGDCLHGKGSLIYPNQDEYVGTFENGLKHGSGTYIHANGSRYTGQFEGGLKHGLGSLSFPDGTSYEGEFENGLKLSLIHI